MFQRVTLMGRVGGDPEMRYTPSGTPVVNFSLATTNMTSKNHTEECPKGWKESYNGKNWEVTTWVRVTFWRKSAETINQYVNKGDVLYVEGELGGTAENGVVNANAWLDKNTGEARASHEVTGRLFKFLPKGGNGGYTPSDEDAPPVGKISGVPQDDLPF